MTDLPCLSIICPEGSEEVLGGAGEGCPFHFPGSPGGLAQAGGAGHFDRDEAEDRGSYLWRGPRYGSPVDGPIPPGRRDSAGPKTPGSPPAPKLTGGQEAAVVALIEAHSPDQLGLPTSLWTRETVGILIKKRFGLALWVWRVGRSLRRWGLTPQKPARRAYAQDPAAVRRWLGKEYPDIPKQAKTEGAEIHWGDEMGVRSDHQAGRTWGPKGKTPVVPGTGQRFRCNIISTLTNQGVLRFRVFQENFSGEVFIDFLRRLIRDRGRKVYLIVTAIQCISPEKGGRGWSATRQ